MTLTSGRKGVWQWTPAHSSLKISMLQDADLWFMHFLSPAAAWEPLIRRNTILLALRSWLTFVCICFLQRPTFNALRAHSVESVNLTSSSQKYPPDTNTSVGSIPHSVEETLSSYNQQSRQENKHTRGSSPKSVELFRSHLWYFPLNLSLIHMVDIGASMWIPCGPTLHPQSADQEVGTRSKVGQSSGCVSSATVDCSVVSTYTKLCQ